MKCVDVTISAITTPGPADAMLHAQAVSGDPIAFCVDQQTTFILHGQPCYGVLSQEVRPVLLDTSPLRIGYIEKDGRNYARLVHTIDQVYAQIAVDRIEGECKICDSTGLIWARDHTNGPQHMSQVPCGECHLAYAVNRLKWALPKLKAAEGEYEDIDVRAGLAEVVAKLEEYQ